MQTPLILHSQNGVFTGPNNVASVFDAVSQDPSKPLVVWFHGGLVSTSVGDEQAKRHTELFDGKADSIYFVWESGISTELPKALLHFFTHEAFEGLLDKVSTFFHEKLSASPNALAAAPGAGPVTDAALLTQDDKRRLMQLVQADPKLQAEADRIASKSSNANAVGLGLGVAPVASPRTPELYVDDLVDRELGAGASSGQALGFGFSITPMAVLLNIGLKAVEIATRVARRMANGRHHGFRQTVIEEIVAQLKIGLQIWSEMKQDTLSAFGGDRDQCVGTAFLIGLADHLKANPDRKVVLVGHSTGAIYICNLLHRAPELGVTSKLHVRFLAPACTFDLFASTISERSDLVASFRQFGMKEDVEHADALLAGIPGMPAAIKNLYMGSLLYFVSGCLEKDADTPIVGMQRYYTMDRIYPQESFPLIRSVDQFAHGLQASPDPFVWSKQDSPAGFASGGTSHGGFSDDQETFDSLLVF